MKNPVRQVDNNRTTIVVAKACEGDPNVVSMKLVDFNERTLVELAKMITVDELPFKFVEYEGFRNFMEAAQPYFKIPLLRKKILKFCLIGDHKVETIGIDLENCLKEWRIQKNCCVIVDNTSTNNSSCICGVSHILNLIVCDGLKEIDSSISKIRVACKFVRTSPSRLATFKRCAKEVSLNLKAMLTLDVSTRWNSIYLMLDMTTNMQRKFNKYWESGEINYLLFVTVFLDPLYKFDYIEFCFKKMYRVDKTKEMLKKLDDLIRKMFAKYALEHPISIDSSNSSTLASNRASQEQKSELDKFLEDDNEELHKDDNEDDNFGFDILAWLKMKESKYHVLSFMARDILVILVSTVSFEFPFSTGGLVLDLFLSSLSFTIVETLICIQNWLKTNK
ncbi:putative AC transposase [Glycine soja]|uniref:Putative AC transposase n=1 Tax=Glycine soja TaxID=3848 RepID=A0A445F2U4_GLYSO|nr:putative AC transposase [Glycine soja]